MEMFLNVHIIKDMSVESTQVLLLRCSHLYQMPFKMKKGETLRITLKAKQYVPEFIRPYWKAE